MMDDYPDDDDPYDDEEHGGDCDCEDCVHDRLLDECGRLPPELGGGCQLAGTEHCDFDCPIRDLDTFREEEE